MGVPVCVAFSQAVVELIYIYPQIRLRGQLEHLPAGFYQRNDGRPVQRRQGASKGRSGITLAGNPAIGTQPSYPGCDACR